MQVWTFLHVTFMFASVALSFGMGWFALIAAWRRDLAALRGYMRISARTGALEGLLGLLGIGFGVVAAIVGGLDLLQGWLVLAYILIGAGVAIGIVSGPYLGRAKAALEADLGDEPGPELEAILSAPWIYVAGFASSVVIVAIIWVMVFKPTLWT